MGTWKISLGSPSPWSGRCGTKTMPTNGIGTASQVHAVEGARRVEGQHVQ